MAPPGIWLAIRTRRDNLPPSLHTHYRCFNTTTGQSVPVSCIGILASWGYHLCFSLNIRTTGSHVPYSSLYPGHAASMPAAATPDTSLRRSSSRNFAGTPVLTATFTVSTPHRRFTFVHLLGHLPDRSWRPFPLSLTTRTLNASRTGRFDPSVWSPRPRGLPSS